MVMDVAISELRANLRSWVEEVQGGSEVVVTERGIPVARLIPVGSSSVIERLEREGLVTRPKHAKRPVATEHQREKASGSVSDLVTELRR